MAEKSIITKENLIKEIAKETNKNISEVKDVYNTLENVIFNILSSVDDKHDICIKLFEGIQINGVFMSEKTKFNNITKNMDLVHSRIKPKVHITDTYCEKLNSK